MACGRNAEPARAAPARCRDGEIGPPLLPSTVFSPDPDQGPERAVQAPPQMSRELLEQLLARHLISPSDMSLFRTFDSVENAVAEVLKFYSVYHSMRFVRRKLVLRLNREPGEALIARLNDEFRDIIGSGKIVRSEALPLESDDPHLASLPRLVFQFNRRDIGRLRQMVDVINDSPPP